MFAEYVAKLQKEIVQQKELQFVSPPKARKAREVKAGGKSIRQIILDTMADGKVKNLDGLKEMIKDGTGKEPNKGTLNAVSNMQ
jgi:hypothetical protein